MVKPMEIGNLGKVVNAAAMATVYGAELLPNEEGQLKPQLTAEGLEYFVKANKALFGNKKVSAALEQVRDTLARRQSQGQNGDALQVDAAYIYGRILSFFQTHIDADGDSLRLSDGEIKKLGKTAAGLVNKTVAEKLAAVDFSNVVVPQEFQMKGAAIRTYLLGRAVETTRDGRYDTWLSEADLHRAVDADVAAGVISAEFGDAAKKTFYYAAQYIYRGMARDNGRSNSICQDMEYEFQRALNRLTGASSKTGQAIAAVGLDEAKARLAA